MISARQMEQARTALDGFSIELPSWGFANTGTRFGKFIQPSAATTTEEKIAERRPVHRVTGCCPSIAMHVLWDFPKGVSDVPAVIESAAANGVRIGAINPNVFEDQCYKHGSLGNPDPKSARPRCRISRFGGDSGRDRIADLSLWFADESAFPGRARSERESRGLRKD